MVDAGISPTIPQTPKEKRKKINKHKQNPKVVNNIDEDLDIVDEYIFDEFEAFAVDFQNYSAVDEELDRVLQKIPIFENVEEVNGVDLSSSGEEAPNLSISVTTLDVIKSAGEYTLIDFAADAIGCADLIDFSEPLPIFHPRIAQDFSCSVVTICEVDDKPLGTPDEDDRRPYAAVRIFDRVVIGLLDSGATHTCLGKGSEELLKGSHLISRATSKLIFIRTADGSMHECTELVDVPITFDGRTHLLPVLIVPDLYSPLILGVDFWMKFDLRIVKPNPRRCDALRRHPVILSSEERAGLDEVIPQFPITTEDNFGRTHLITHRIDTLDNAPVHQRCYPVPTHLMKAVDVELDRLLKRGVIRECEPTPWLNPVTIRDKKDGRIRFCLDARGLNNVTVRDTFPLPHIEAILSQLSGAQYLSSIDLSEAFFQIPLDPQDQQKTAFALPGRKLYCFQRTPFGLVNSPMTMARLMSLVLGHDLEPFVYYYLDDVLVVTPDFETHVRMLGEVAKRLKAANLTINLAKSKFCVPELSFLGLTISSEGISTNTEKIDAIIQLTPPRTVKGLRQVIGMMSWYRKFIPNFSTTILPLTNLLKGKPKTIEWSPEADRALEDLKRALISAPILATADYSKPFRVKTDSSDFGCGGVLVQGEDDKERVIAYMSRKFTAAEKNYTTTEQELLGVLYSIEKFRQYLVGARFVVETDHSALQWLLRQKEARGRLARWILRLQEFDFEVRHRPGRENIVPDALSRCFDISSVAQVQDKWYSSLFEKATQTPEKLPDYKVEDGRLYKLCRVLNDVGVVEHRWKLVVPKEDRVDVMRNTIAPITDSDASRCEPLGMEFSLSPVIIRVLSGEIYESVEDAGSEFVPSPELQHLCRTASRQKKTPEVDLFRPRNCISCIGELHAKGTRQEIEKSQLEDLAHPTGPNQTQRSVVNCRLCLDVRLPVLLARKSAFPGRK
ncbi:uncharacterized protein LOC129792342 [Lutzomyia longipalpis]|uniref:uncharacterized protein LOC129792342 n=1 Tax=Lutzomyia longipalpis TaxID=7200 RepID=UPI0024835720|nr:uncharacterized protein LOC129792342 [Lutzomyia longipalpis]